LFQTPALLPASSFGTIASFPSFATATTFPAISTTTLPLTPAFSFPTVTSDAFAPSFAAPVVPSSTMAFSSQTLPSTFAQAQISGLPADKRAAWPSRFGQATMDPTTPSSSSSTASIFGQASMDPVGSSTRGSSNLALMDPVSSSGVTAANPAWPSRFGAASMDPTGPSQWSQASNSWVAPPPSWSGSSSTGAFDATSSTTIVSPMDPVSAYYSRPTNQGFLEAEVHTFSDNLQPGYQAKKAASSFSQGNNYFGSSGFGPSTSQGSNYWNPAVNPGWNAASSQQGGVQGQAPQATISFAGIASSDSTGVTG